MEAHIRMASRKEIPGFLRPSVCSIGQYVHYTFRSWKDEVSIPSLGLVFRPVRRADALVYALPDGSELSIARTSTGQRFDGVAVHERWPTTQRRELVCGPTIFRVKPEDDTLLFDFTDEVPDLATTLIGFYIYLGDSSGGDT